MYNEKRTTTITNYELRRELRAYADRELRLLVETGSRQFQRAAARVLAARVSRRALRNKNFAAYAAAA